MKSQPGNHLTDRYVFKIRTPEALGRDEYVEGGIKLDQLSLPPGMPIKTPGNPNVANLSEKTKREPLNSMSTPLSPYITPLLKLLPLGLQYAKILDLV